MSEPIQSIAQNNYILHNIDAKKLYVQEPLFTANSGDAVYVGWRPDETVLFESDGTQAITAFTASEPLSSFDKVEFTIKVNNDDVPKSLVIPMIDRNVQSPLYLNFVSHYNGWKNTLVWQFQYNTTGTSAFSAVSGAYHSRNDAGNIAGGDWNTPLRIYKIVGINRKENA